LKFGSYDSDEYLNTSGEKVRFTFEGLTSLIAIYDDFEDGSEISWSEYENRTARKIKSWVKAKEDLEVFDRIEKE
jgi:hypothetical protein